MKNILYFFAALIAAVQAFAAPEAQKSAAPLPQPTFDSVAYGNHPMQRMDVWLPEKGALTPAIIFVHGGGFRKGDRRDPRLGERIPKCRAARVALISVEYRLLKDAGDVKPPVRVCLDDVTAAIRFVRSKAAEWRIDTSRIGLTGSSAGAHAVLYASLTGDNEFGIRAVYAQYPQTSIDPKEMREWIPNSNYGAPLFGYPDFQTWLDHRDEVLPWIEKFSPAGLLRRCTPARAPAFVHDGPAAPKPGEPEKSPTHSGTFRVKFAEICAARGITCCFGHHDLFMDILTAGSSPGNACGGVCADVSCSNLVVAAAADLERPVRPGGVDGRPFWNAHSIRFLYPPAFDLPMVEGAVKYRFTVVDDVLEEHVFEADRPTAPLSPVWKRLPVGYARVFVQGMDAQGRIRGESGSRRFWRDAPYAPGTYRRKPYSYRECVKRYYPVLFSHGNTQHFLKQGTPDGVTFLRNVYPSKMNAALIHGMLRYAKMSAEHRDDALKVAKAAGDFMISLSQPADAPLAHFPPTYREMNGQKTGGASTRYAGQNMLVYPARMGTAYLDLYKSCGERRFLDAALGIAQTYRRLQLPEGTWYLKMWERDGTPVLGGNGNRPVRMIPIQVCEFMEELADVTGDTSWRDIAARAFSSIENGPLKTWDWAAQFEDTPPSAGCRNHSSCEAMSVAQYLLTRHSQDAEKMKIARELVRWVEDQFVFWRKPCRADGKCVLVGKEDEFGPWAPNKSGMDFAEWPEEMPGVAEKYHWSMMESALATSMAKLYYLLYRHDGDLLALEKARTLCDSVVRIQEMGGEGEIASEWRMPFITGSRWSEIWMNCSVSTVLTLEELASELE